MQTVDFAFGPANGRAQYLLVRDVPIPRGVTDVFASIQGFTFAFGVLEFTSPGTSTDYKWHRADHHFGLAEAYVQVVRVMSDKVTLRMGMLLRDDDGNEAWTGIIKIGLLFLGPTC